MGIVRGFLMSIRPTSTISAVASLLLAIGCFVEVSSSGSSTQTADGFGARLEAEFALKTGGVGSTIRCPSGVTGQEGNRFICSGETSDGYTLEIAVLERAGGAFRWDVVESKPIR